MGVDLCNSLFNYLDKKPSVNNCSFIYEEDLTINTTKNSEVYETNENIVTELVWELAEDNTKTCPTYCKQCDLDKKCIKCAPHYKIDEDKKCVEIDLNCELYEKMNVLNAKLIFF